MVAVIRKNSNSIFAITHHCRLAALRLPTDRVSPRSGASFLGVFAIFTHVIWGRRIVLTSPSHARTIHIISKISLIFYFSSQTHPAEIFFMVWRRPHPRSQAALRGGSPKEIFFLLSFYSLFSSLFIFSYSARCGGGVIRFSPPPTLFIPIV